MASVQTYECDLCHEKSPDASQWRRVVFCEIVPTGDAVFGADCCEKCVDRLMVALPGVTLAHVFRPPIEEPLK